MGPCGNSDGGLSQASNRPLGLTLSRCRTNKQPKSNNKLRTDNNKTKKGGSKRPASRRKSSSSSRRRSICDMTLPVPSFLEHAKRVEDLEKSFFDVISPPSSATKQKQKPMVAAKPAVVHRPPIPSFTWNSDTEEEEDNGNDPTPEAVLVTKKKCTNQDKPVLEKLPNAAIVEIANPASTTIIRPNDKNSQESGKENNVNDSREDIRLDAANSDCGRVDDVSKVSSVLTNAADLTSKYSTQINRAKTRPKAKSDKGPQPTHDELTRVADENFAASDVETITIKQFILGMEASFQIKLTNKSKAFVKKRLYYHINDKLPSQQSQEQSCDAPPMELEMKEATAVTLPESNDQTFVSNDTNPLAAEAASVANENAETSTDNQQSIEPIMTAPHNVTTSCQPTNIQSAPLEKPRAEIAARQKPTAKMMDIINLDSESDSDGEMYQPVNIIFCRKRPLKTEAVELPNDESFAPTSNPSTAEPQKKIYKPAPNQVEAHAFKAQEPAPPKIDNEDSPINSKARAATKEPPAKKKAAAKPARKRKTAACRLCKTCPCRTEQKGSTSPTGEFDLGKLKRSERAIERKLESRLDELQREAERYEGEADRVRRELKKRDRVRLRREQAQHSSGGMQAGKYHFLPEGSELDNQLDLIDSTKATGGEIKKAQIKMFGKEKQPAVSQPTLTQMFGGGSKDSEEDIQEVGDQSLVTDNLESVEEASLLEETKSDEQQSHTDDRSVDDSLQSCFHDEEEAGVASASRVLWRNGNVCRAAQDDPDDKVAGGSVWGTLVTSALQSENEIEYGCGFNRVFGSAPESTESEDGPGIDHLLGLFEDAPSAQSSPAKSSFGTPQPKKGSPIDMSMLTQRGKWLAEGIQNQVIADSDQFSILEAGCPNWQENVLYAMHQKDPAEIDDAMSKVQKAKARLARMQESFLKAMQEQTAVLDVFEMSLKQSRGRLNGNGSVLPATDISSVVASPTKDIPMAPTSGAFF